ncbi:hypothetical protein GE09DRAFT_631155 [Coniochaeta sp. 2T2.1]|nr:hypothetical protein GE09DRAFT_631155 [Coniochaeta sp. 2T2.1]
MSHPTFPDAFQSGATYSSGFYNWATPRAKSCGQPAKICFQRDTKASETGGWRRHGPTHLIRLLPTPSQTRRANLEIERPILTDMLSRPRRRRAHNITPPIIPLCAHPPTIACSPNSDVAVDPTSISPGVPLDHHSPWWPLMARQNRERRADEASQSYPPAKRQHADDKSSIKSSSYSNFFPSPAFWDAHALGIAAGHQWQGSITSEKLGWEWKNAVCPQMPTLLAERPA